MPQWNLRGGKPLHERTPTEIVWLFGVVPILFGSGLFILATLNLVHHVRSFQWRDWLGVLWALVMSAVLVIGLPGTGWRELQRRKQFQTHRAQRAGQTQ